MVLYKESFIKRPHTMGVSRETYEKLKHFVDLFEKWANVINLVAPSTLKDIWERHIMDSLQIYKLAPGPKRWVDLGSGGGFPGVIIAICLAETKDGWVHLVESNNKKASFLRTALAETGARGSVHPIRIEEAPDTIVGVDIVSARALAALDTVCGYAYPWAKRNPNLRALLHKGRDYRKEVEVSRRRWDFDLVKHSSVVESDSWILELSALTAKIKSLGETNE